MEVLLDSYETPEFNQSATSNQTGYGQTFNSGVGGILGAIEVFLHKVGNPPGDLFAYLYAHTGTYGTDGVPTGSALVTSMAVSAASLKVSGQESWVRFPFSESYILTPSTAYCLVILASGSLDVSNHFNVWADATSPSHGGNQISTSNGGGSWSFNDTRDCAFRVYTKTEDRPHNHYRRVAVGNGMSMGERAL